MGGGVLLPVAELRAHGGVGGAGGAGRGGPPGGPLAAAGGQHPGAAGGQPGRPLHPQPDGGGPATRLPRYQGLHRRQAGDGGREREAGE